MVVVFRDLWRMYVKSPQVGFFHRMWVMRIRNPLFRAPRFEITYMVAGTHTNLVSGNVGLGITNKCPKAGTASSKAHHDEIHVAKSLTAEFGWSVVANPNFRS